MGRLQWLGREISPSLPAAPNFLHYFLRDLLGSAYVVFGMKSGWPTSFTSLSGNTTFLNGTNGVELDGVTASNTMAGNAVADCDLNGDGYGDIIVAAPHTAPGGANWAGSAYVFFGRKAGLWSKITPFNLGNL